MNTVAFAVPGALETPTGGYRYDRRVMADLAMRGISVRPVELDDSFPFPAPPALDHAREVLTNLHADALIVDGLAYGALPLTLVEALDRPVIALVHHPLAYETGLSEIRRESLYGSERAALACATRIITTSKATARLLHNEYAVPAERLHVAEPGVDRAKRAIGDDTQGQVRLLTVGAISLRKGYHLLIEALAPLRGLGWHLEIVGAPRDDRATARLQAAITQHRLEGQVCLAGALDDDALETAFNRAHIFVVPSLYEGYGMGASEAIAHGLPLVTTTGGALDDTVPDAVALKVAPGDIPALSAALEALITGENLRAAKAEASWNMAGNLPRWSATGDVFIRVLKELLV